ncbi:serine/threonine-protein kinase [Corallococcus exiguus]|uniref:serine/threonine-protein kinase n=1 Tax=Corallococcus exiguus TaxID=83462 RepID=UPI001494AE85|nr:serine/threonine-protein kinase [Corallococcus exiguus]NPD27915.1 protein kinase [Corallococcus exiguus]NRD45921.1 protein kinase [Corallococcus exiguus]
MATPVEPEALTGPVRFGPYTLVRRIGAGGMGEVFLAREEGVGRAVVVKKVLPGLVDSRQFVGRFRDEARVVVRLAHPNIARVYAMGEVDGQLYLAMEYVLGKTLSRLAYRLRQRQRMMPLGPLLQMGIRLCEGLAYAHDATDEEGHPLHLVHRDLSPANVCVSYAGEVKIIDFGAAQSTLKEQQTAPRVVIGNLTYMAPEQARKRTVDRRADLYAVGVVLWELFSWKPLSQRGDPLERWRRAAYPQWEPAGRYRPDLPRAVDAFLARALASEPNDRFPTATAMAEALGALKEKLAPNVTDQDLVRLMSAAFPREKVIEQQMLDDLLREQPERANTRQEFPSVLAPPGAMDPEEALRAQEDIATEALDAAKLRRAEGTRAGEEPEAPGAAMPPESTRAGPETGARNAAKPPPSEYASVGQETEALDAAKVEQALRAAAEAKRLQDESGDAAELPRKAPPVRLHNLEITMDAWLPGIGAAEPTTPGLPPQTPEVGKAPPAPAAASAPEGTGPASGAARAQWTPGPGEDEATPQEVPGPLESRGGPGSEDTTDPGERTPAGRQAPAEEPSRPDWNPGPDAKDSVTHLRASHSEGPPPAPEDSPMQNRPSRPGWTPGAGSEDSTTNERPARKSATGLPAAGKGGWTPGSGEDDATEGAGSSPMAARPSTDDAEEESTDVEKPGRPKANAAPRAPASQPRPQTSVGPAPQSRPATSVGAAPQARPAEAFPDATRPMSQDELPVPWSPQGAGEATEALEAAKIFGALSQTTGNMPAYLDEKATPYVPPKEVPRRQAPVVNERPHETRPMQVRTKTRETLVGYDMDISEALRQAELKRREAELAAEKRNNKKKKPVKSKGGNPLQGLWPIPPQYRFWAMLVVVALACGLGFGVMWLFLGGGEGGT